MHVGGVSAITCHMVSYLVKKEKLIMKNWIIVLVVFVALLSACGDQNGLNEGELGADQAKQSLEQLSSQMQQDVIDMVTSDGVDALLEFAGFMDQNDPMSGRVILEPGVSIERAVADVKRLAQTFSAKKKLGIETASETIDLSQFFGVYEWDAVSSTFVKNDEAVEFVEFRFPVKDSQTNNAVFRLLKLEEQYIGLGEISSTVVPTAILAELYVDDKFCASLNFEANYSSLGLPESIEVSLFLDPFTHDLSFSWDSSQVNVSFGLTKGSDQLASTSVTANLGSEGFDALESLEISLIYRNFKIAGSISAPEGEEVTDINELIDIAVYEGEDKIGDLEIEIDSNNDEATLWVVLADGTKVDLEEILQPVIDELEDIIVALGES